MPKVAILTDLKKVVRDVVDDNGNIRLELVGNLGKRKLPNNRVKLIKNLFDLVLNTSIVRDVTRMYILDRYITQSGLLEELQKTKDYAGMTYNQLGNILSYDRTKLSQYIGPNFIADVVYKTGNDAKIEEYAISISRAYAKFGTSGLSKLRENLLLHLDSRLITVRLDDEKFDDFIQAILPYVKLRVEMVEQELDKDSVGYFNYLLNSTELSDVDKERLGLIRELLDPDYIQEDS